MQWFNHNSPKILDRFQIGNVTIQHEDWNRYIPDSFPYGNVIALYAALSVNTPPETAGQQVRIDIICDDDGPQAESFVRQLKSRQITPQDFMGIICALEFTVTFHRIILEPDQARKLAKDIIF